MTTPRIPDNGTSRARSCPTCQSIGAPRVRHEDQLCQDLWHVEVRDVVPATPLISAAEAVSPQLTPSDSQHEPRRRDDAAPTLRLERRSHFGGWDGGQGDTHIKLICGTWSRYLAVPEAAAVDLEEALTSPGAEIERLRRELDEARAVVRQVEAFGTGYIWRRDGHNDVALDPTEVVTVVAADKVASWEQLTAERDQARTDLRTQTDELEALTNQVARLETNLAKAVRTMLPVVEGVKALVARYDGNAAYNGNGMYAGLTAILRGYHDTVDGITAPNRKVTEPRHPRAELIRRLTTGITALVEQTLREVDGG